MNVQYSDGVKQLGEAYELARHATNQLEEILGPSAGGAVAEWDRTQDDKGRTLLTLRLRDFTGEASTRLAPDELRSPNLTGARLHKLWGDLLLVQLKKQVAELATNGGQL